MYENHADDVLRLAAMTTFLAALAIPLLLSGLLVGLLARSKARSFFGWFVFGAVLPLISLIALLIVPSLREERGARNMVGTRALASVEAALDTKICPACAETIKRAAKVCRFCGADVAAVR